MQNKKVWFNCIPYNKNSINFYAYGKTAPTKEVSNPSLPNNLIPTP